MANDSPLTTTSSSTCELVHNAAPGISQDGHSPPCVAVGQVPQQPGPILLTYRYWFLFLGLLLVSFLMPIITYGRPNGLSTPNQLQGSSPGSYPALCTASSTRYEVTEFYGRGEGIEGSHCGLHSDYIVSCESPFDHL